MEDNPAEDIVQEVLGLMKKEGKISGFRRSKKNDADDIAGIDFLIFLNSGLFLPAQVKTHCGARKDKQKLNWHTKHHPEVRLIIFVHVGLYRRRKDVVLKHVEGEISKFFKA